MTSAPSRRARVRAAAAIGVAAGLVAYASMRWIDPSPDFLYWWTAARALLRGANPYVVIPAADPRLVAPFFYPLPAAVATIPFALLRMEIGGALFVALGAGLFAFALAREGWHRLFACLSGPFVLSCVSGHWPPLLTACALLAPLGPLTAVKPNLGLVAFAYRPRWSLVLGAAAFTLATLAVNVRWPLEWLRLLRVMQRDVQHPAPVLTVAGAVVLLALVRWRRAEARALAALVSVPQVYGYDQLALWLVPRTLGETVLLTAVSQVMLVLWLAFGMVHWRFGPSLYVAAVYWPCVVMVLRRRNVSTLRDAGEPARADPPGPESRTPFAGTRW